MIITNDEYVKKFNATDSNKSSFQRHLDVCGIKTKNDKKTRGRKFLWGITKSDGTLTWKSLNEFTYDNLTKLKTHLSIYPHSIDDENIGWTYDLIDYMQENGCHA